MLKPYRNPTSLGSRGSQTSMGWFKISIKKYFAYWGYSAFFMHEAQFEMLLSRAGTPLGHYVNSDQR